MSSQTLEVVALTSEREVEYEDFVRRHPAGLLYYSLSFRDFLVELLGCEPRYAVALRDGAVTAALPLMAASGPYGIVLNALPFFGSNGDVLATNAEDRAAVLRWYADCASADDVATATIVENPLTHATGDPPHDLVDNRIGTITPLPREGSPSDAILEMIDGSARRNVKKAARSGVTVEVDNAAVAELAALHHEGMAAVGGRTKSRRFFDVLTRCFAPGDGYDIYVGRLDGEVIAALLVLYFESTVEYYMPASSAAHRSTQPMAAVLHQAMADATTRGFRQWNWGGSWVTQENLLRFKAKWGGRAHPYRYWTKVNQPAILHASPEALLTGYPDFFVIPFAALKPTS